MLALIIYTPIRKEELDEGVVDERLVLVELGGAAYAQIMDFQRAVRAGVPLVQHPDDRMHNVLGDANRLVAMDLAQGEVDIKASVSVCPRYRRG